MRITRNILVLGLMHGAATASLAGEAQERPQTVQNETAQNELIGMSSSDFTAHGPTVENVRNVHIRYQVLANGERSYILCGQFRSTSDGAGSEWTHFATIKTDSYEQWIGGLAQTHCERATVASSKPEDLSAVLQAALDAAMSK